MAPVNRTSLLRRLRLGVRHAFTWNRSRLFAWLRWLGAIYLVWLGIGQWRAPGTAPDGGSALHPARAALVSLTNPKTILFLVAFFPQFVVPGPGMRGRIVGLCLTYLAVCVVGDGLWALLAARVAPLLSRSRSRSSWWCWSPRCRPMPSTRADRACGSRRRR